MNIRINNEHLYIRYLTNWWFMNCVARISQLQDGDIHFGEPITNTLFESSNYYRVFFSTPQVTINGIAVTFDIIDSVITRVKSHCKITFCQEPNEFTFNALCALEKRILAIHIPGIGKTPKYSIADHLATGVLNLCADNAQKMNTVLILKISGLYETSREYGLTYKFYRA